jgi:hypothetical protein
VEAKSENSSRVGVLGVNPPGRANGPDLFGTPLDPDPSIALQPPRIHLTTKQGPLYKVQYVVEFVGPRSIPASVAANLFAPEWYSALGQPFAFSMRPADLNWAPLTTAKSGSYDSLAIAWDLVSKSGLLSCGAASHLLSVAERFGATVNRRVLPLPVVHDVDRAVTQLVQAKESLDVGFSLSVIPFSGSFPERDLWIECARLGLSFSTEGSFDWCAAGHAYPLLSVTPIGATQAFALRNVQAGLAHEGISVGFSVPLSISPSQALDACFYVAERFSIDLGGEVFDQDGARLTDRGKNDLRSAMKQALSMFSQLGVTTGSAEAIKIFG